MKRAIMERVQERIEQAKREGTPLSMDRLSEMVREEWQRAKQTVRTSSAARQAAREYSQRSASDIVDSLTKMEESVESVEDVSP